MVEKGTDVMGQICRFSHRCGSMSDMMPSCCRWLCSIFLIILLNKIPPSEEIKWTSVPGLITYAHKGQNKNLTWEYKEEGEKIIRLEWYFKSTLICFSSSNGSFEIHPSYQGRIERIGKSGLLLNNVSIEDEGTYTLNLVISWSSTPEMQNITLHILVPPPDSCSYNITCTGQLKGVTCDIMRTDCGGQEVSAVRKRRTTQSILGYGYYLYFNLESRADELFFCANKKAMECVDGSQQSCTSIPIQPTVDKSSPMSNNNTLQGQLFTTPALKDICTCTSLQHHDHHLYILISSTVLTVAILLSVILFFMNKKWMCIKKLETEILEMRQQYRQKDYIQGQTRTLTLRDRRNHEQCANDMGSDPREFEDDPFIKISVRRGSISQGGMNHQPKEDLMFQVPAVLQKPILT